MSFLLIPVFAFLYRCRGGFLSIGGTFSARMVYWALPVLILMLFVNPYLAFFSGLGAYLGLLIPHGWCMADTSIKSMLGMAVIGVARLFLILLPIFYNDPHTLVLSLMGSLQAAAYYVGWEALDGEDAGIRYKKSDGTDCVFAKGATEWAELLTGAAFGLAFAVATVSRL